jgi:hypothetical protein
MGCRNQLKKWTQKELAAACRGMTHCAISAWHQGPSRDSVVKGTSKGRIFEKRGTKSVVRESSAQEAVKIGSECVKLKNFPLQAVAREWLAKAQQAEK